MKLIFIYGAPAAGKLTIAKELSAMTGLKLHHNHMAIDLALGLFDFDNPNFLRLCQRINLDVFDVAAHSGLPGLIFTFAYGGSFDDPFIDEIREKHRDHLCPVHLSCSVDELKRRVTNQDRRSYKKCTDVRILQNALQAIDYAKDIEHPNHLSIDTTSLPPRDAARRIADHYSL